MATLTRRDLERSEEFLLGLYSFHRVQSLICYVLKELPLLVGANHVSWNHVVPALQQADVIAWPPETEHQKYQAVLERHLHEHPLICHQLHSKDQRAIKLSDFLSKAKFHSTALYDELYRHLEYEDQFAMPLAPIGAEWTTLVVARDRRTFTERDRAVLNFVRPHIARAYRQVRALSRLERRVEAQRAQPATSRVQLDRNLQITRYPMRAQRWIEFYCDELPSAPCCLPKSVLNWLIRARGLIVGETPMSRIAPLVFSRGGRQLIIHLPVDGEDGRTELALEERIDPLDVAVRLGLPLTRRELDVLLAVEQGMHNAEIASELGIRPRTVKKHLEHVFDKLGVDNRTAAVARLHEANRRLP